MPWTRIRAWLPRGDTLPDAMWARRHRWLLALAWAHVPVLLLIGLLAGYSVPHTHRRRRADRRARRAGDLERTRSAAGAPRRAACRC